LPCGKTGARAAKLREASALLRKAASQGCKARAKRASLTAEVRN